MDNVRHTISPPAPWGLPAVLTDGTRVRLRPILPGDKNGLRRGMAELSPAARRHRFFSARDELDDSMVAYLTEVDYRSHFAWVAIDLDRPGQPIVAVGRYVRGEDDPAAAEIAFVVGDDYQHRGLATLLLDLLIVVAEDNGIDHFMARVMTDNLAMRHVLTKAGAKMVPDDAGVLRTTLELPPTSGRFDPPQVVAVARAAGSMARRQSAGAA